MEYDLVVIGSGPGGYVCAIKAAQLGLKVACVEMEKTLGGTCLNVGCIPSKAILESSHHWHKINHEMADHGISVKNPSFDLSKMIGRKDEVVSSITKGVEFLFQKNKISWLKGKATFVTQNEIEITGQGGEKSKVSTKNFVIATGSKPIELPFAKFDQKVIVSSTDALSFSSVPKKMLIIGGGVIGVELGSVWSRLGASVTVIEASDHILGAMDRSLCDGALKILKKQGIEFFLNTKVEKIDVKKDKAQIQAKEGDKTLTFEADKVLVCVGRGAYTEGLGLEKIGVVQERGKILADKHLRTNISNIFAIGDVTFGPMLAHKAEEEGIYVAEIIAQKPSHMNYKTIASIVYTWPEVASVGKTEEQCKEEKIDYKVGKFLFKSNGRAKAMGETEGFAKMIACKKTDELLGCHILGATASEMIAEIAMAMEFSASCEDVARSVHAHPTLCEILKEAALDADKIAIHS